MGAKIGKHNELDPIPRVAAVHPMVVLERGVQYLQRFAVVFDQICIPLRLRAVEGGPKSCRPAWRSALPGLCQLRDQGVLLDACDIPGWDDEESKTFRSEGFWERMDIEALRIARQRCDGQSHQFDPSRDLLPGVPFAVEPVSRALFLKEVADVVKRLGVSVVPVYDFLADFAGGFVSGQSAVCDVVLEKFPMPREEVGWERVHRFRSSGSFTRSRSSLLLWMGRASSSLGASPSQLRILREELESILEDRRSSLEAHRFKIVSACLETLFPVGLGALVSSMGAVPPGEAIVWSVGLSIPGLFHTANAMMDLETAHRDTSPAAHILTIDDVIR